MDGRNVLVLDSSKYSKCELPCPKLQHVILGQVRSDAVYFHRIFNTFFFSTLYLLTLVSHHPFEVCCIHPLPSKLFCSQHPIFSQHVSLRLVSCSEAALLHSEVRTPTCDVMGLVVGTWTRLDLRGPAGSVCSHASMVMHYESRLPVETVLYSTVCEQEVTSLT